MDQVPSWESLSSTPPAAPAPQEGSAPSWDELELPEEHFGSLPQQGIAALEGAASGISLGASKIAETKLLGVKPEDIQAREEANPATSFLSNVGGTAALLAGTGGLGLAAEEGAGLAAKIGSNALQGALIGGVNSVTNDQAFGDPQLAASKIAAHAGIAALYGAGIGGVGSAILDGSTSQLKNLGEFIKKSGKEIPSVAPQDLSFTDKVRLGFFHGFKSPEAQEELASNASKGLQSLHDVTKIEDFGSPEDPSHLPLLDAFQKAKDSFLHHFGDNEGNVDSDKVLDYLTSHSSKNSAAKTVSFNHYLSAIDDLSAVKFQNPEASGALEAAKQGLDDWTNMALDYNFQGPKTDYQVSIGSKDNQARVSDIGNERVSPFEYEGPKLGTINSKIEKFQNEIEKIARQSETAAETEKSLSGAQKSANQLKNISQSKEALEKTPEPTMVDHFLDKAEAPALWFMPKVVPFLEALKWTRKYSGDGGYFRLGKDLASGAKILDGVSKTVQTIDQKIGDKARLIFTGASNQSRKLNRE